MTLNSDKNAIKTKGWIHFLKCPHLDAMKKSWKTVSQVLHELFLSKDVLVLFLLLLLVVVICILPSFCNKKTNKQKKTFFLF
jgi:hypothetical protein